MRTGLEQLTQKYDNISAWEYNEKTTSTDIRGNITLYTYDDASQIIFEADAKGNEKETSYNGIGRTITNKRKNRK